jgi:tetratricopeptide (TPR) repeat protein
MDQTASFRSATHILGWGAGLLLVLVAGGLLVWRSSADRIPAGVTSHEYRLARLVLQEQLGRTPGRDEILLKVGESIAEKGRWEDAVRCFAEVSRGASKHAQRARFLQAMALAEMSRLPESEAGLRDFLGRAPGNDSPESDVVTARRFLAQILGAELRFDQRRKVMQDLLDGGEGDLIDLLQFCFTSSMHWNNPATAARIEAAWKLNPGDLWLQTARGRYLMADGRLEQAHRLLADCVQSRNQEAQGALLECLRDEGEWQEMQKLVSSLPAPQPDDSGLLLRMRGHTAEHFETWSEAEDCYRKSLVHDPANVEAWTGLVRVYGHLRQLDRQAEANRRATALTNLQPKIAAVASHAGSPTGWALLLEIGTTSADAGLDETAARIAQFGMHHAPEPATFRELRERVGERQNVRESD